MKNRYELAKNAFVDATNIEEFVEVSSSVFAYEQLEESLDKPIKMILFFGKPGTGKSILLHRLYTQLKYQKEIHYFPTPPATLKEFLSQFFKVLTGHNLPPNTEVNFSALVKFCETIRGKREIIILLDEAQMYTPTMMEKIRLLSDTHTVKFVITLHKTEDEELIAKEHFQSRILETIELKNVTQDEQTFYIHQRLLKQNLFDVSHSIKDKSMQLIYQLSKGNHRECNKLLFTIFEICDYYDKNEPTKIDNTTLSQKIIEMAALKLGYIHA
ncbi:MAG: AAA family ATPase [Sulfurovum sp.]|nr:MAG: AAA family ATPase [Sulfurovum sp.]